MPLSAVINAWSQSRYRTLNTIRVFESALQHNLNVFRELVPGQAVCPVLKSNAYGHGLVEVAEALLHESPEFFIVDSLYEAYKLQKAGVKSPTLILGYTFPENLHRKLPFEFTVSDLKTAEVMAKLKLPVHLEVDTGMGRMGFNMNELDEALTAFKQMGLNMTGLFTHFADADNPEDLSHTQKQVAHFQEAIAKVHGAGFKPRWIHASNSAGAIKAQIPELNMMRLGLGLYGISPYKETDAAFEKLGGLQTAMEVESSFVAIKELKAGETVSYACTFTAPRDMRLGVLPFGYYEGLPLALSNHEPFLGRICMNHSMVDLSHKPETKVGDPYLIYERQGPRSVTALAKAMDTIPYELMVRLAESIRRVPQ